MILGQICCKIWPALDLKDFADAEQLLRCLDNFFFVWLSALLLLLMAFADIGHAWLASSLFCPSSLLFHFFSTFYFFSFWPIFTTQKYLAHARSLYWQIITKVLQFFFLIFTSFHFLNQAAAARKLMVLRNPTQDLIKDFPAEKRYHKNHFI